MFCQNCGNKIESHSKYCGSCGHPLQKSKSKLPYFLTALLVIAFASVSLIIYFSNLEYTAPSGKHETLNSTITKKQFVDSQSSVTAVKSELTEPPKDVSEIISAAQPKVFTILTTYGFGSGFLIDEKGHVLTNAHVVEGEVSPVVRTMDGAEYEGKLVGYSNTTDIAVIQVPALEGRTALQLEESTNINIGDEVIALGSPRGYENTATLGNISGVDRTFVIPPFEFEGVYQMSAPIAPGSSGGPLLSKQTGKVIAINSARDTSEMNIGFSIPVHQVTSMINNWINSPMLEDDIYALFYYDNDLFYFNDYLDSFGYFSDDGDYSDYYYEYYEIPFDESYWFEFEDDWYWEDWEDYDEEEYWYWDDYEEDEEYWYSDEYEYDESDEDYYDDSFDEWEEEEYDDEWDDSYEDDEEFEDWEDIDYEDEFESWDEDEFESEFDE
ncbi:trypsin-like peptidase domain-containing protein [Oceanobacillus luteolus]|uniref:trypsin-like peptidase domain-containing protein n=1 Tax=Oceanobacillus luteolus TaxID=1274358 RepID=UPI0020412A12|nr:trypsin-like peptidase domain-containing protein [Oceanobacillus luteolus]MCM3740975.1 trypsin-like peptidase domain-containing protein [Oceanobacillus luteolus]